MYYLDKKVKYNSPDFKALFNAYFPTLCLYAERIVSDSDAAKDVVQEVFIKLLKSDAMFENEKSIKAYLYILTRNSSIDSIKKNRNSLRLTDDEYFSYSENDFLEDIVKEETYRMLDVAIKKLGLQSQKIIQLSMNQLSNPEIAEELDISVNTVKTLKLRAYKKLKNILAHQLMSVILLNFLLE
ncbi:sigma-70 family RNA polymerase sigma factor [Reichenbachiella sp. MALMAid0571]|uniref:RNA polymerase sigma factor n=1 Tax=Reichenbachiella sp. MALMAid0571 TaxID=3143939 RepID=UPI0032DF198E